MGIKDWLLGTNTSKETKEVSCEELFGAAREYQIRNLCFWTCVSMISNALAKCEFRTFEGEKEVRDREYYLWNIEPNVNQSRKVFMDKLIAKLYSENEALIVPTNSNGDPMLLVADSWNIAEKKTFRENTYTEVQVGDVSMRRSYRESEVYHFSLNHVNIKPLIDGFYDSYYRLVAAAMKYYRWSKGQHWKVHVDHVAQGADGFNEKFANMMTKQVRPFLESDGAILPEFDGYSFENVGTKEARASTSGETVDIRNLVNDIFDTTAKCLLIPPVLLNGAVENTDDAMKRWLTVCIDPLCAGTLQTEINRKQYGFAGWKKGNRLLIDTSKIEHFDLFANADNIAKLIASGYSYNDVLHAQGQPPINEPWANQHFFTKNNTLAEDLAKGGENE